jgi:hypothetical protein
MKNIIFSIYVHFMFCFQRFFNHVAGIVRTLAFRHRANSPPAPSRIAACRLVSVSASDDFKPAKEQLSKHPKALI